MDEHISEEDSSNDRNPKIVYGSVAHIDPKNCNSSVSLQIPIVQACWKTNEEVEFFEEEEESSSAINQGEEKISNMMLYVTEHTVVFLSSVPNHSVQMDAECIVLHAQTDDCVVYLQLQESNTSEDVLEFTVTLKTSSDSDQLFQELTNLVAKHPVDDDLDYANGGIDANHHGGANGIHMGDSCEDDMIVANGNPYQRGTSEDERNAMLDRLDAILVVPPHLRNEEETIDGQFDDADGESGDDDDVQLL
jgi:hypothetical protein